ncbi:hypothetical protein [Synechococcus sp. CS-1328]|uniref:hypothetical protein n=1 Tax=Synechococcus sp. CS-1328 TaxID=2847976 RepID=UPI00223AE38D|nr:hypothetical protein [Synechococcus sp. CS-1328]MCT0223863.1 hypothetical protein [Synechococcus sp. CS-1328]
MNLDIPDDLALPLDIDSRIINLVTGAYLEEGTPLPPALRETTGKPKRPEPQPWDSSSAPVQASGGNGGDEDRPATRTELLRMLLQASKDEDEDTEAIITAELMSRLRMSTGQIMAALYKRLMKDLGGTQGNLRPGYVIMSDVEPLEALGACCT